MRQFGARSFDLAIDTGKGTLLPPVGDPLLPRALEKAVADAGFELLGLELEVHGLLRSLPAAAGEHQTVVVVEVETTGQQFALLQGPSEREHAAWALLAPQFDRSDALLWVRGRVPDLHEEPPALLVNDFRFPEN